ncbi:hypothetical protein SSPIM334S_01862 [Streptomyces spiroverticillatus]
MVVRERRPDAAAGLLIKPLAPRLDKAMEEFAAKPYEELIQLIRTGPPRFSPFQLKQIDEASNTIEFYVHTEDVRQAQPDWTPRELDPVFQDALWSRLERSARLVGRSAPTGLVLRRPDGQTAVAHKGTPVVTVTGEPSELLMFAYGRQTPPRSSWTATRTPSPSCTRASSWGSEGHFGSSARRRPGTLRAMTPPSPHTAALATKTGPVPHRPMAAGERHAQGRECEADQRGDCGDASQIGGVGLRLTGRRTWRR